MTESLTLDEMKQKLEKTLSRKRFIHSLNVMDTAVKLAGHYGADTAKIAVAGLLHDCARELGADITLQYCSCVNIPVDDVCRLQPELLHGPVGAHMAEIEYEIRDNDTVSAIYHHTLGYENMTLFDKIIFIADYIEPGRTFRGVEGIRKKAFSDLDAAILMGLDKTIQYVLKKKSLIHPETIKARNYLLAEKKVKALQCNRNI